MLRLRSPEPRRRLDTVAPGALLVLALVLAVVGAPTPAARAQPAGSDDAPRLDPQTLADLRSYTAHLAAAESALRLGDVAGARRWLDDAPHLWRGWEHRRLVAAADAADPAAALEGRALAFGESPSSGSTRAVAWDRRGGRLAAAISDANSDANSSEVVAWSVRSGEIVARQQVDDPVDLAWHSDDRRVAVAGASGVSIVDLSSGPSLEATTAWSPLAARVVAWSPDGRRLAAGTVDGSLLLGSGDTRGALRLRRHEGAVDATAWSPDGGLLATGAADAMLHLWLPAVGSPRGQHRADGALTTAAWRSGRALRTGVRLLVAGGPAGLVAWSAESRPAARRRLDPRPVRALAWSADGRRLAVAVDGSIVVWAIIDPRPAPDPAETDVATAETDAATAESEPSSETGTEPIDTIPAFFELTRLPIDAVDLAFDPWDRTLAVAPRQGPPILLGERLDDP